MRHRPPPETRTRSVNLPAVDCHLLMMRGQSTVKPNGRVRRATPWISASKANGFKSPQNSAAITVPHPNLQQQPATISHLARGVPCGKMSANQGFKQILKKNRRGRCSFFSSPNKIIRRREIKNKKLFWRELRWRYSTSNFNGPVSNPLRASCPPSSAWA